MKQENANMRRLGGKKRVFWKVVLQRFCWWINDAMKFMRDHLFCYYEVDVKQVKAKVRETNEKAEKFEQVKEKLPDIYTALQQLRECSKANSFLQHDIKVLRGDLYRLYSAYLAEDKTEMSEIFNKYFKDKILD